MVLSQKQLPSFHSEYEIHILVLLIQIKNKKRLSNKETISDNSTIKQEVKIDISVYYSNTNDLYTTTLARLIL